MTTEASEQQSVAPTFDFIEHSIARDLAKKALIVAPVVVVVAGVWRGLDGAAGAALGLVLVALNFLAGAALMGWAARISPAALAAASLGGYVVRMAAIFLIALGVDALGIVDMPSFVVTVLVSHLGLLFWELRSVSLTLAYPGLKPGKE